jgi:hypothetical protein
MTDIALTEHFMIILLSNSSHCLLTIYNLDEVSPKLIDEKVGVYIAIPMSTGNYLDNSFYLFFYDKIKNELYLNQYIGNILTIEPKSSAPSLDIPTTTSPLHWHQQPFNPAPTRYQDHYIICV